jgi:endonuclease/exonuclease/phosphatase family metal-dependent hydrolase
MQNNQINILTYNIHKGFSAGNKNFVLHQLREALLTTDADILFLQEIQGEHTRRQQKHHNWPQEPHLDFLASERWQHSAYAKNAVYSVGHHGNAILSRYPIMAWENINVSPLPWASRSLLHAEIALPNSVTPLHIICIHLGLTGMERRPQLQTLFERIEAEVPHEAPLIVAGDFNDWTLRATKQFAHRLNLQEAHKTLHNSHARTWPAWLPILKVDRIYYRGLQAVFCESPKHRSWHRLSDHAPLMATFEVTQ